MIMILTTSPRWTTRSPTRRGGPSCHSSILLPPLKKGLKTFQLVHFLTVFFGSLVSNSAWNWKPWDVLHQYPHSHKYVDLKSISHIFHISWATRANWIELSEKYPWAQIWGFCGLDLDHKSREFWQRMRRRGAGGIAIQAWLYKFYKKELLVCSRARAKRSKQPQTDFLGEQ